MRHFLTTIPRSAIVSLMAIAALGVMTGCGTFQFAPGSVISKRQVTEYHPNGRIKNQGWVGITDQGVEVKTDQWQWWYDNGQVQWQGYYLSDAVDNLREWKEWNRNGSLRDTWIDR